MFGFKKKEKKIEDLVSESFDKVINLTKNGEHEAATKETDNFTKLLEKLPGNEKWKWYDKLTIALVEAVNNSKNADNKENKESKSVSKNDIDDNDEDSQDEEIKTNGSETARQNKIKETLIDPNPLYIKWYKYFWKNKLHEDVQAKKFCPRCYYVMYNKEHRIWNGIDLTENDWNMTVGCIYGDIAPVLNFEVVCTVGIRDEFTCLYAKLASLIDENKIRGLCTYVDFDKDALN